MFRRITMLAALVLAVNTVSYAQDAETESSPVYKNLGIYICGGTGNINPKSGDTYLPVLKNWSEFGVTYSQNVSTAPWLGVNLSLYICTESDGLIYDEDANRYYAENNAVGQEDFVTAIGQVNLAFGKYVSVDFRSTGRVDLNLQYSYSWGDTYKQRIRFRTYLDIHPTGTALYGYDNDPDDEGEYDYGNLSQLSTGFINEFQGRVDYTLNFHKNWAFNSEFRHFYRIPR